MYKLKNYFKCMKLLFYGIPMPSLAGVQLQLFRESRLSKSLHQIGNGGRPGCLTLKKMSATHVIKLGFAPNSYPPGQPMHRSYIHQGQQK